MQVFHQGFAHARGKVDGCAVALGNFDGVHLGHQALFREAVSRAHARGAKAVAATFNPHPGKILMPALAPKLLTPLARKLELMEACGLDAVIVQAFDADYATKEATAFLADDLLGLAPKDVVVGHDFTYGRGRKGTVQSLRGAAEEWGIAVTVVPAVTLGGVVVSSSKVREFVMEGRVEAAARLLGRPFDLTGVVAHGMGRGRGIGFPTANIVPDNEVQPGFGVYAVRAWAAGQPWAGAVNIGRKPTFGEENVTLEVHLLDFSGDLYGQRVGVEFLERLRGEQRFASVDELKAQIARDVADARRIAASAPPAGPLGPRANGRAP